MTLDGWLGLRELELDGCRRLSDLDGCRRLLGRRSVRDGGYLLFGLLRGLVHRWAAHEGLVRLGLGTAWALEKVGFPRDPFRWVRCEIALPLLSFLP